jgi:deoxyribodipyrimidine photo-lyase
MNSILIVNQLLRVKDNTLLIKAMKSKGLIAYYFLDHQQKEIASKAFPTKSFFARKFELESLHNLKISLERLNIPLIIDQVGSDHLATLVDRYSIDSLYSIDFATSDEQRLIEKAIKKAKTDLMWIKDHSDLLYPLQKLPFNLQELPEVFTVFRKKVEKYNIPEKPLAAPECPLSNALIIDSTSLPALSDLGYSNSTIDSRSAHPFKGGEDAGWERLDHYFWQTEALAKYKQTRNGLIGLDFSSKLSAYLALGCLSPRSIYTEIKEFESSVVANQDTYWLFFELLWREYFKLISFKHKDRIFKIEGILNRSYEWGENNALFEKWIGGKTKDDFVNAAMIELKSTGWISNRARQNVASYWAKNLKQNWIWGARYFEAQLIDYDASANWGNWCYVSGVGNDPRDRKFNTQRQAEMYDPNNDYRRLWLQ